MKEDLKTWANLQKGQIAELALERMALAAGYGVKYTGNQYHRILLPKDSGHTEEKEWTSDIELYDLSGDSPEKVATVEVKWRSQLKGIPTHAPKHTTHLFVFYEGGINVHTVSNGVVKRKGKALSESEEFQSLKNPDLFQSSTALALQLPNY